MSELIRITNAAKQYQSGAAKVQALSATNLVVETGEFVVVIGKSGSGKSTLLNLLAGIDRQSSGSIVIDGIDLEKMSESQLDCWRGANVGVVFQFFQLMPNLTALENLRLPMDFSGRLPNAQRLRKAETLLARVGLADRANHFPAQLSGGEQQRVAIARALANNPVLLLADEPTGNLDSENRTIIYQLFKELNSIGLTIVMVSHDADPCNYASREVQLHDGFVVSDQVINNRAELRVVDV